MRFFANSKAGGDETKQNVPLQQELSSAEAHLIGGGEKTCIQSCERVEGTNATVCSPTICFVSK